MPEPRVGFGDPVTYDSGTGAIAVTATGSPFTYSASAAGVSGDFVVTGGTVSAIGILDGVGTSYATGATSGVFHLSPNNKGIKVTYTAAPTITFIPD